MTEGGTFLVSLDVGSTKICVVVAKIVDDKVNIAGIGSHPSTGLRKGVVVNIDSTVNSIKKALEEAELMAGIKISGCLAGIAGAHIRSFNSNGVVAVKEKEVRKDDIARAIDAAKAVAIPADRDLLHVIPQEYIVDDQDGIKDPVGMSGGQARGQGAYRYRLHHFRPEHRQVLLSRGALRG